MRVLLVCFYLKTQESIGVSLMVRWHSNSNC